jgi:hypothetical protein
VVVVVVDVVEEVCADRWVAPRTIHAKRGRAFIHLA